MLDCYVLHTAILAQKEESDVEQTKKDVDYFKKLTISK